MVVVAEREAIVTFDEWLFGHAVDLNDTPRSKAELCRLVWNAATVEERERLRKLFRDIQRDPSNWEAVCRTAVWETP